MHWTGKSRYKERRTQRIPGKNKRMGTAEGRRKLERSKRTYLPWTETYGTASSKPSVTYRNKRSE
jgi:hypothetical protein